MNEQNKRHGRSIVVPQEMGKRMRELRDQRHLSQKELAGKARVSPKLVSNIENKEAPFYEIEIYTHPEDFDETKLNAYWVPEKIGSRHC